MTYKRKEVIGDCMMEKFDEMPRGWCLDASWGSPLNGYTPIHNRISLLNGGKKGLLKIKKPKNTPETRSLPQVSFTNNSCKQESNTENTFMLAKKMNDLARLQLKETLIRDITIDLMICKVEKWDFKEYIKDLKRTIDDVCKSIINENASTKRVKDAYKQPDMFGY